jgi:hypothetical protein
MAIDEMYDPCGKQMSSSMEHKDEGEIRQCVDREDRPRILHKLKIHSHPLVDHSASLYNIVNGQLQVVSTKDVNVHNGQEMQKSFTTSLPAGFHNPIKMVKTMQIMKRGVNIKDKTVYELEALFARLL